jgi:hypothetical protein
LPGSLGGRGLAAAAAAAAAGAALSLATHDPIADGPLLVYARGLAVAIGAAAAVWALLALQFGAPSVVPLAAAGVVLATAYGLHFWRASNPLIHGAPLIAFASSPAPAEALGRDWDVETSGGGTARAEGSALLLTSAPRASAYVRARLSDPKTVPGAWWAPVAAAHLRRLDEVTWRAAIERREAYLGIFQSHQLTLQAVEHGILVSYPDARGDVNSALLHERFPLDGRPHRWRLVAGASTLSLSVDDAPLWTAPRYAYLDEVRLGEPRAEPDHGGVMTLYEAAYVRRLVRP